MRKIALLLVLLAWAAMAVAAEGWRVGGDLVLIGDTMVEVRQVAGPPDQRSRIENDLGGTVGNRWYYVETGYDAKTVVITFRGGRVVEIEKRQN